VREYDLPGFRAFGTFGILALFLPRAESEKPKSIKVA
jgi:hypothetical protein